MIVTMIRFGRRVAIIGQRGALMVVLAGTILGVLGSIFLANPANAFSSQGQVYVAGDNTFYAYVLAGEKVSVGFNRSPMSEADTTGIPPYPVTITVNMPGAAVQTCVIPANVAPGAGCGFDSLTAPKTGIWSVVMSLPDNAYIHKDLSSTVKWGGNAFSWHVTVTGATGEMPGRVWSDLYAIWQPLSESALADLTEYYMSEDGYLYRAIYKGYNGGLSTLSADAFGVVKDGTCTATYQSIEAKSTTMTPSFGNCGGSYKLFFEQPSDDLPTQAPKWDGTGDWVRPAIDRPVVEGLKFTPDNGSSSQSGKISYNLKNFVGQYEVKIDTNGDGIYDGPDDITIHRQVKDLKSAGVQTIVFDGNDHNGNPIPTSQHIKIKINISKAAEIHLVAGDVEGRQGGIELVRLSGDNVPSSNVCWDDTNLAAVPNGVDTDLTLDGTSCPASDSGVHAWKYDVNEAVTWGNARYIDDWAYADAKVDGTAEIEYPTADVVAQQSTQRNMNIGLIIVVVLLIASGVGAYIYRIKQRNKREAKDLLPPSNFQPPSGPNLPPPQL